MSNSATFTNTFNIAMATGVANTAVIHRTEWSEDRGFGLFAHCNYNGRGRALRTVKLVKPGESITGNLCGKCFAHCETTPA